MTRVPSHGLSQHQGGLEPTVDELVALGDHESGEGLLDAAVAAYQEALRREPHHVGAHIGMGRVRAQQQYFPDAARHYLAAAEQRPDSASLLWQAGSLHLRNYTYEDGIGPLLRARSVDPNNAALGADIARAYVGMGAPELAIPYLDEALRQRPDDPYILSELAGALTETGEFERANELYRRVIDVGGDAPYSLFRLALNATKETAAPLRGEIDAAMERVDGNSRGALLLRQGAHRVCADLGDWPAAYDHLLASKQLTRGGFDRSFRRRLEQQTTGLFTAGFLRERGTWGDAEETPVFVVGMPRSGSTLLESVLAGHPSVSSLGERNYVDVIAHQLWYGKGGADTYEQKVRALDRADVGAFAADYQRRAQMLAPRGRFAINKMLTSYQHVGLIMLLFPRARIIHCRRSPLDSCWSIFSNPIEHGHPYASSMEDLAWTYAQSLRYMQHWTEVLPDNVIEVQYEELVADLRGQTQRLLGFLGLPWNDACLAFDRRDRSVQTMSARQVRGNLSTSSIGRWRQHREFLEPLVGALLREGVIDEQDLADELSADG